MRFRARLASQPLQLLISALQSLSKISGNAFVLLSPTSMRVSATPEVLESPRGYLEIHGQSFSDFVVTSQHDDQIAFEIVFALLVQALTSGRSSTHVNFRLSRREDKPCLTVSLDQQSSVSGLNVVHDIPIKLLRVSDQLHLITQPNISPPHVAVQLSRRKAMKTIVDRLGKFSKHVSVHAFQHGRVVLSVEGNGASIHTILSGQLPRFVGQLTKENSMQNEVTAVVHVKQLASILDYQHVQPHEATICKFDFNVLFLEVIFDKFAQFLLQMKR